MKNSKSGRTTYAKQKLLSSLSYQYECFSAMFLPTILNI